MKNTIILLILLSSFKINAQTDLTFDKLLVESVDQWVAFKMNEDGTHNYGFIYIDPEAGLTLNSEGTFKPKQDGSYEVKKLEASLKIRLEPNRVKVAVIPADLYKDLQIEAIPEWLKYYKKDINTAKGQYNLGYLYNGWNECAKALEFLNKANELDPDFKGLAVERAFSYNCLKEYGKAAEILEEAIVKNESDAYMNKELIYSLTKIDGVEKATKQFYAFTKNAHDKTYDAENCFNIMQYYYQEKDKKNFMIWYKELKKWPNENAQITKYVEQMKAEL